MNVFVDLYLYTSIEIARKIDRVLGTSEIVLFVVRPNGYVDPRGKDPA